MTGPEAFVLVVAMSAITSLVVNAVLFFAWLRR